MPRQLSCREAAAAMLCQQAAEVEGDIERH